MDDIGQGRAVEEPKLDMKELDARVRALERQIAGQGSVQEVVERCKRLEERLEAMRSEFEGKLKELAKEFWGNSAADVPETGGSSCSEAESDDGELQGPGSSDYEAPVSVLVDVKPFQCGMCPGETPRRLFDSASELSDHYTSQHPIHTAITPAPDSSFQGSDTHARLQTHICSFCSKYFTRRDHLRRHLVAKHADSESKLASTHICEFCAKAFAEKYDLRRHQRNVHDIVSEFVEPPQQQQQQLQPRLRPPKKKKRPPVELPCPEVECTSTFPNPSTLLQHRITTHGLRPFECSEPGCEAKLGSKSALADHFKSQHTEEERIPCHVCGRIFFRPYLARHMKRHQNIPPEARPYLCDVPQCGAGYFRRHDLDVHTRRHTGERPFQCPQCELRFTSKNTLRGHVVLHMGKPHMCDECGRSFAQGSHLKIHKRNQHALGEAKRTEGAKRSLIWVKTKMKRAKVHLPSGEANPEGDAAVSGPGDNAPGNSESGLPDVNFSYE